MQQNNFYLYHQWFIQYKITIFMQQENSKMTEEPNIPDLYLPPISIIEVNEWWNVTFEGLKLYGKQFNQEQIKSNGSVGDQNLKVQKVEKANSMF